LNQFLARIGQLDVTSVPLEQSYTQLVFERTNGAADRRLGHMQAFGSSAKVELFGNGKEGSDVFRIHAEIIAENAIKSALIGI
jgi:hypothetical protein